MGSSIAAAKRLGRATSAISYAIDSLEEQLGLSLFDRGTTRKPKLTAAFTNLIAHTRAGTDPPPARARKKLKEFPKKEAPLKS